MTLARAKPVRQERSRRTRDRLLAAGHALLSEKPWAELSVTAIAKRAGCSVGSFYARYGSKEEFFEALCADYLDSRNRDIDAYWNGVTADQNLAHALVTNVVNSIKNHRNLWQAALTRSALEPHFWDLFRGTGMAVFTHFTGHLETRRDRPLTEEEIKRARFAQLLLNGYINNTVMVQPGLYRLEDEEVIDELTRAVALVAEI
jgi:AcrR family transcriptional regulator